MNNYVAEGDVIKYTNATGSTILSGALVALGMGVGIAIGDIINGGTGALQVCGLVTLPKKNEAMAAGLPVGFDSDGNPYLGTAGTGAASLFLADANFVVGCVAYAATAAATTVTVVLNKFSPKFPYWPERTYETVAAAKTLDVEDNGKVFQDLTDNAVITLVAVSGIIGFDVIIQNMAAAGGAKLSVDPEANDRMMAADLTGVNNKDLINTKTTQEQGDYVHIQYGTDPYVINKKGIWAAEG